MKTATMTIDVTYDEGLTDPDALSTALDTLLVTALSTPGILDEYGDLSVGDFRSIAAPGAKIRRLARQRHYPLAHPVTTPQKGRVHIVSGFRPTSRCVGRSWWSRGC